MASFGSPTKQSGGGLLDTGSGLDSKPSIGGFLGSSEKKPQDDRAGTFQIDLTDPVGSGFGLIGEGLGLAGKGLGVVGSVGIPGGPTLGDIPRAIGDIGLPGTDRRLGNIPGNTGRIVGNVLSAISGPGQAVEEGVAAERLERVREKRTDIDIFDAIPSFGNPTGALRALQSPEQERASLPPDILARLEAGEDIDALATELTDRGQGFSSNVTLELIEGIVLDPTNFLGGVTGKVSQAGRAYDAARAAGVASELGIAQRTVGRAYSTATHGLSAAAAASVEKVVGPATRGAFFALGPKTYTGLRSSLRAIDPDAAGRFDDALGRFLGQLPRAVTAHMIGDEVRAGLGRVVSKDEVADLVETRLDAARKVDPAEVERRSEELLLSTTPDFLLRTADDVAAETAQKLSVITNIPAAELRGVVSKGGQNLARLVHGAFYGAAGHALVMAKRALTADEAAAAKLTRAEDLTVIAPDTLTVERALELEKAIAGGIPKQAPRGGRAADLATRLETPKTDLLQADPIAAADAAVERFSILRNRFGGRDLNLQELRDFIQKLRKEGALPSAIREPKKGKNPLPTALGEWRERYGQFGYTLGFGPADGWKTIVDDAGEVYITDPFVHFVDEFEAPTVRNPLGRAMDSMFRGVSQVTIIHDSRVRMVNALVRRNAGISPGQARAIHKAILAEASSKNVTPRGLSLFGGVAYDEIFERVLGPDAYQKLTSKVDPTWLVMHAFEGNLNRVGLSQKFTGAAKTISADVSPRVNLVAAIAEGVYPLIRFRLSPLFQVQEILESPFLNLLRGVKKAAVPEDVARIYDEMAEMPEFKWVFEAGYVTHLAGGQALEKTLGKQTVLGRIVDRFIPDVRGVKERARAAQLFAEHGEAFENAVRRINPALWRELQLAYGTTDRNLIAFSFLRTRMALAKGNLDEAMALVDEVKPAGFGVSTAPSVKWSRDTVSQGFQGAFGIDARQADALAALTEARARTWARVSGRTADEWYETRLAGLERGTPDFDLVPETRGVPVARDIATRYMERVGIQVPPRRLYQADEDFGLRTARAYDSLPETAFQADDYDITVDMLDNASTALKTDAAVSPQARASYKAFVEETAEQYRMIRESGVEIVPTLDDPYPNSAAMMADVRDNNRLFVFAGSAAHPLMTNEQTVMFRGVHDFFAHAAEGNQFGPRGELNAAIKHSNMYSPTARRAMLSETHGQNSFVNFSDKVADGGKTVAEINKAKPGTIYATQKAELLPDDIVQEFERRYLGRSDELFQASDLLPAVKPAEGAARVARYAKRDAGKFAPKNQVTRFGNHAVGPVSNEEWLELVQKAGTPDEIAEWRHWYEQLSSRFSIYGEDAPKVMVAWLMSQVQASPSQGFMNVLRAMDERLGIRPNAKSPGVPASAAKVRAILGGGELTPSDKLYDFADSALLKGERSITAGQDGLQPAAIDVWASRDLGFVDPRTRALAADEGLDLELDLKYDGNIDEPRYEYGVRRYNEIAQHLNEVGYLGGGWTAHQAQAVGWVRTIKAFGGEPELPGDIINKNIRRVAVDLGAGEGSPNATRFPDAYSLERPKAQAITQEFYDWAADEVASVTGVKVVDKSPGLGFWEDYPATASAQFQVLGSPEAVEDFMDGIGFLGQQTEVLAVKFKRSGKAQTLEFIPEGEDADEVLEAIFAAVRKADPEVGLGAMPIVENGKRGILLANTGGAKWNQKRIDALMEAYDGPAAGVRFDNADVISRSNDWTKETGGEAYKAALAERGRERVAGDLVDRLGPAAQARLEELFTRHAPDELAAHRGAGGAPAAPAGPARPAQLTRLADGARALPENLTLEPGHLYHITRRRAADLIAETGIEPRVTPGGGTRAVSFWGKRPAAGWAQTDDAVIFRTKDTGEFLPAGGGVGDNLVSETAVPNSALEFFGDDGLWHPATGLLDTPPSTLAQAEGAIAKGSTTFLDDGRAVLRGLQSPDLSTGAHELFHVFRRDLVDEDLAIVERELGVVDGRWTREAEEKWARLGERWLRDGKTEVAALRPVMARFREWLMQIYRRLRGSSIEPSVSPDMRKVIDRLFADADELPPAGIESFAEETARREFEAALSAHRATSPSGSLTPELEALREKWYSARSSGSLRDVERVTDPFAVEAAPPPPATARFDPDEETVWQAFRESFRKSATQAFSTHYFRPRRGWLERTVNHPYLGLYPLSYMWGKVLPEFARFLLKRPFGLDAPLAGQAALTRVQQRFEALMATDPEFQKWTEEHKDAIYLIQQLLPGTPSDLTVRAPAWARHTIERAQSRKGIKDIGAHFENEARDTMGYAFGLGRTIDVFGSGARDLIDVGRDLAETLADSADQYDAAFPRQ